MKAPVFLFPTNLILRVNTIAPFQAWHVLEARYTDGSNIPQGHIHGAPDDDIIRLYGLGGSSSKKVFYFLGTRKQAAEAHGNLHKIDRDID
ncbi:MAG TPA: hypothetical protein VJ063_19735 [Verrucomicrobiae bacterium]|nr:hypothetical protein [Verrucomicrobiae bacterium]